MTRTKLINNSNIKPLKQLKIASYITKKPKNLVEIFKLQVIHLASEGLKKEVIFISQYIVAYIHYFWRI